MRYLWFTSMLMLLVACGNDFFTATVKRYYFVVEPATRENHRIVGSLMGEFNSRVNFSYLRMIRAGTLDDQSKVSTIKITPGLQNRSENRSVGLGRWIKTIKLNSRRGLLRQPHKLRKDIYAMELEFDEGFLKNHYDPDSAEEQQRGRTLFLHELGHGFQMGHDRARSSVMYEEIDGGSKDYDSFYERAYRFLRRGT